MESALWIERELVEQLFAHKPYVNGRIITVTQALLANPLVRVLDLKDDLQDRAAP